jgi:hypothetical protein
MIQPFYHNALGIKKIAGPAAATKVNSTDGISPDQKPDGCLG